VPGVRALVKSHFGLLDPLSREGIASLNHPASGFSDWR